MKKKLAVSTVSALLIGASLAPFPTYAAQEQKSISTHADSPQHLGEIKTRTYAPEEQKQKKPIIIDIKDAKPISQDEIKQKYKVVDGGQILQQFGADTSEPVNTSLEDLETKQNVKNVDIPEGASVINFDNVEQYKQFLSILSKEPTISTHNVSRTNVVSPLGTSNVTRSSSEWFALSAWLNLVASFSVYNSGSFFQINGVNWTNSYLSGVTVGVGWTPSYTDTWISSDRRSATVTFAGTADYTIFINGIGKWASEPRTYELYY